MSLHPRTDSTNRFPVFQELIPEYAGESLLDFGGNRGNLLYFSNGVIPEEKYTCVDLNCVDMENWSILKGEEEFPNGNFITYNRYNEMYNHKGNVDESFPTVDQHDYIWAYSVFSHMKYEDILDALLWMKTIEANKIYVSYLCNDGDENSKNVMEYFYQKRVKYFNTCVDFRENTDDYFYLTDNNYGASSGEKFISVFNSDYLISKLLENGIVANKITCNTVSVPFLEISYV